MKVSFVLISISMLIFGCDPTKSNEYITIKQQNVTFEQEIKQLQLELTKWKADDKANYKQLQESLEKTNSVSDYDEIINKIQKFQKEFPISDLHDNANNLLIYATSRKSEAKIKDEINQLKIAEEDRLKNSPLVSISDYDKNPARFDNNYLNKTIKVNGIIKSMTSRSIYFLGDFTTSSAYFNFNEDLLSVNQGEYVTIGGTYVGLDKYANVILKNCKILKE